MLRFALLSNAAFSTISGILLALSGSWLNRLIPLPPLIFLILGVGLLLFAIFILWVQQTLGRQQEHTSGIIISDWAWVFGTVVLALIFRQQISNLGWILIIVVNVGVALLACLQLVGLKRLGYDSLKV